MAGANSDPAAPAGGDNILKVFGKQRTYAEFTTPATGAGGVIRLEFDGRLDASSALSFGLIGDAAANSLDGLPTTLWLQFSTSGNLAAYNGGWNNLVGVSYTASEWQHYVLEHEIGSSEFKLTAGTDEVVSAHLNGVTTTSQFTHAFFNGGTNATLGYIDNVNVTFDPIPEPASLGLLSLGALAMLRRRN